MSTLVQRRRPTSRIPSRILVAGSDLLAGALASGLETHGFATMHVVPNTAEIERGIKWRPDLVLFDVRSLDVASGSSLIEHFSRSGLQVCVIDATDDDVRRAAWLRVGPSEIVDRREPFDQLFLTISRLLRVGLPPRTEHRTSSGSLPSAQVDPPWRNPYARLFAALTYREEVVLAELLEGHCAEEIAKSAFLSISTIRSQIKSILQKLGVNSQLAAVALARRAGWSLDEPGDDHPGRALPVSAASDALLTAPPDVQIELEQESTA
jgi:two-component system, NarL family, nitrate/nitrite response regulator NarL